MRHRTLFLFFFIFFFEANSQTIDSLLAKISQSAEGSAEKKEFLVQAGHYYFSRGYYKTAVEYYRRAAATHTNDPQEVRRQFSIFKNLGATYEQLGNTDSAIYYYEGIARSSVMAEEDKLTSITKLAELRREQGSLDQSIRWHLELIQYYEKSNRLYDLAKQYNELGLLYFKSGKLDESKKYFDQCEALLDDAENPIFEKMDKSKVYINLGIVYSQLGELRKGEKSLLAALDMREGLKDPVALSETHNYLAAFYLATGNTSQCELQLQSSYRLLEKVQDVEKKDQALLDYFKIRSELLLRKEDYKQYKQVVKEYNALRDKIIRKTESQRTALQESQFERERKEYELQLDLSEKEKEVQTAQLDREKKEKELLLQRSELNALRDERNQQEMRLLNETLEKTKMRQFMELSKQREKDSFQKQQIQLLEKDQQLHLMKLKAQEKQIVLQELESQKMDIAMAKEKEKKALITSIVFSLVILLAVVVIALWNNRRNNKLLTAKNKELFEAHAMIELQNEELISNNESLEAIVTERTKELIESNAQLIENNTQLRQFAYIISHNLRSPIAKILSLNMLIHHIPEANEEVREITSKLDSTTKEMDAIIKDLNQVIEVRNMVELRNEKIDLYEVLEKAKLLLSEELKAANMLIKADFSKSTFRSIRAYIENIFFNLISNAAKYKRPDEDPVLEISVKKNENNILEISFRDNGLGIDLEKHGGKLFGLYKRFHLERPGKGMGLYMVKTQVEALGGKITVDSKPNTFTRFTILMPYQE